MPSLSPIDPPAFVAQFESLALASGFSCERFGEIKGCPLAAFTRRATADRPSIYLSAGIHGDEPAPPFALQRLLERNTFDQRATWFICPLLNPAGFSRGSRENSEGLDLNRDYRQTKSAEISAHLRWLAKQPNFDLALCLHEDWESTGTYLYELNPNQRPSLAEPIVEAVGKKYPIDRATLIDGRAAQDGIIRPDADPLLRDLWPEAIYLRAHHTELCYTIETPSGHPLEDRIAAQCIAVETAVARFTEPR